MWVEASPEGLASILRPVPWIGTQTGVAAHEHVPHPVVDAQVQEVSAPQNKGSPDTEAVGREPAECFCALGDGIPVLGWMMGAG